MVERYGDGDVALPRPMWPKSIRFPIIHDDGLKGSEATKRVTRTLNVVETN